MNDDSDLRELFARQRAADSELMPDYRRLLQRAGAQAHATGSGAHTWWPWALAGTVGAAAILAVSVRVVSPQPSLVESLPVLLPPASHEIRLFAELESPAPSSPSDFLLPACLNINVL